MMKRFLIVYFLFSIAVSLSAQRFKAGILVGVVTSQVDGDTYAGYSKAGVVAGAFVSKKLSPESKWSALFEITYIQKGSRKIPHPDKGDYADYKLKLNYAEVPILLKYDFAFSDSLGERTRNFAVLGGVAIGALVKSAEFDAFGQLPAGTPFQKSDISYVLGLSYSLSEHIDFEARTMYSLVPVRKGGASVYYPNWTSNIFKPGYYNNVLVFAFKYKF